MPISPNSFTSTAVRAIAGWRRRWFSTVVLPAPRKPVSTVTGVVSAIECFRVDQRCGDLHQGTVPHRAEETVAAAGVAGDTLLIHEQQDRIAIAIDAELAKMLWLVRC